MFDPGGRAIEWNVGSYLPDSFAYTVESERDKWIDRKDNKIVSDN